MRRRAWLLQTVRFAVVGAGCAVVDLGLFNLLHFVVGIGPLTSKTLAVGAATLASYLGNRHWTFTGQAGGKHARDLPMFAALNGVGLLIALAVLAAVRYGLGVTDPLPLNILGNGGGIVLATAFRFWAYRRWVFRATAETPPTRR